MADGAPSPKAILRGHKVQIHTATFIRNNERLVTGDADGWVVSWDLTIMRPKAVWQAHAKAMLRVMEWGNDKIITHGRDNKLIVWRLGLDDEENLDKIPPVEQTQTSRRNPWTLYVLEVNTMNFCSFAVCPSEATSSMAHASEILIALPNTLNSEAIDIYSLPSQTRLHTIKPGDKNGMAMALEILHHQGSLTIVAGWENGYSSVHRLQDDGQWAMTYRSQAHSQPILSLAVHPSHEFFLTSGADSMIVKHPIPISQQMIIDDTTQSKERVVDITDAPAGLSPNPTNSLLAASFKAPSKPGSVQSASGLLRAWKDPIKGVNTKHSGQQSLKLRSDGRIFVTAGWDSKARVYSAKTLKELAVLKWHQVGCYAVATSDVTVSDDDGRKGQESEASRESQGASEENHGIEQAIIAKGSRDVVKGNTSIKDRRIAQARAAHWIAAGAKDGKISLWDIY